MKKSMTNINYNKRILTDKEFSLLIQNIRNRNVVVQPIKMNTKRNRIRYPRDVKYLRVDLNTYRLGRTRDSHTSKVGGEYRVRVMPRVRSRKNIMLSKKQYNECLRACMDVIQRPPQNPRPIDHDSKQTTKGGKKK